MFTAHYTIDHLPAFLLAFLPAFFNLVFAFFVFFRFPRREVTLVFGIILLFTGFWQFGAAFERISADAETANFWDCLFSPFGILSAPIVLHFALVFIEKTHVRKYFNLLSFFYISTFLVALIYPVFATGSDHRSIPFWGWTAFRDRSLYNISVVLLLGVQYIFAIALLTQTLLKSEKGTNRYYQLLLFNTCLCGIIIVAFITEAVIPFFDPGKALPLTPTLILFYTLGFYIAMSRFRMFDGIDAVSKEDLLASISDIVIVVNANLEIVYMNEAGLKHTGFEMDEVKGKLITYVLSLPENKTADLLDEIITLSLSGSNIRNYKFDINSRQGGKTPVLVTSDVLKNRNDAEGILLVSRNIADLQLHQG
jgi:PAS domain S-box-containing protein